MESVKDLRAERDREKDLDRVKTTSLWRRIAIYGSALFLVFLLGFLPMWLSKREAVQQREAAQANLRLSRMQNRLGTATINARHGDYEPARVAASDFFTDLRAEVERSETAFTASQVENVKPFLQQRDELITLLARNDAAANDRLTDLYLNYVQAINPSAQNQQ